MVKILDCTLRDGGYINNWKFGCNSIKNIYENLLESKIDYIEAGFLKDSEYNNDYTLFNDIEKLNIFKKSSNTEIYAMIILGQFQDKKIIKKTNSILLDGIRINFKKDKLKGATLLAKKVKDAGYKVSFNPTHVDTYSKNELISLINTANEIKPDIFYIVDTKGALKTQDLIEINKIINEYLDEKITLGFHSHNNLQLSFSHACYLINNTRRKLTVDSSISGIGRCAGNLPLELLVRYLNENFNTKYNINPILKTANDYIKPIFIDSPWGCSTPYKLSAINKCHPYYAKFLINKGVSNENIDKILKSIPNNKKTCYDEALIRNFTAK